MEDLKGIAPYIRIYAFAAIYLFCFFSLLYPLYFLCTDFIAISTLLDLQVELPIKLKNLYACINKINISIRVNIWLYYPSTDHKEKQIRTNADTIETIEIIQITIHAQMYMFACEFYYT